jgi:hypothetical protein|tara:strand:+ start:45 stop:236 length:192 start_codon:yes stop_codon:yes gene_type:complete
MKVKDLKVGSVFQMEGLNTDGEIVKCDATLRAAWKDQYVVESDGITINLDGSEEVSAVYSYIK